MDEASVDGFNITYVLMPGSFEEFAELVIPVLAERGLLREDGASKTLRDNLFGDGDQLANHHVISINLSFCKIHLGSFFRDLAK